MSNNHINGLINLAKWIFFTLLFLAGCSLVGCNVLKTKQEKKQQTVATANTDSGHVSKSSTNIKEENEWWRAILQYQQPKNSDTTINNFYSPKVEVPPKVIILEGGKGTKETQETKYDSTWDKRFARLEQIVEERSKKKETEVLNTWQIIGLIIGACIVTLILSKLKFSWR